MGSSVTKLLSSDDDSSNVTSSMISFPFSLFGLLEGAAEWTGAFLVGTMGGASAGLDWAGNRGGASTGLL